VASTLALSDVAVQNDMNQTGAQCTFGTGRASSGKRGAR
jgi:hypothetical protein